MIFSGASSRLRGSGHIVPASIAPPSNRSGYHVSGQTIRPSPRSPYHYGSDVTEAANEYELEPSLRAHIPRTKPEKNPLFRANSSPGLLPHHGVPTGSSHSSDSAPPPAAGAHPLSQSINSSPPLNWRRTIETERSSAISGNTGGTNDPQPSPLRRYSSTSSVASSVSGQSRGICLVCMAAYYNVLFIPCCHVACCGKCAVVLESCPVCRKEISKRLKIFPV